MINASRPHRHHVTLHLIQPSNLLPVISLPSNYIQADYTPRTDHSSTVSSHARRFPLSGAVDPLQPQGVRSLGTPQCHNLSSSLTSSLGRLSNQQYGKVGEDRRAVHDYKGDGDDASRVRTAAWLRSITHSIDHCFTLQSSWGRRTPTSVLAS
jgi:hypothetical protein